MELGQSFEILSTKCTQLFNFTPIVTKWPNQNQINMLLVSMTLTWFVFFWEHQSPLLNNFEAKHFKNNSMPL
jgi:hypothetical protein